ncbi:ACT domain-containing protein [Lawsonibacter sp. LCP25S3_G6]|uniref:ACT domain-containing protein n=1 Tax=unclassified Lawsonibacter TaxID=2617946 RepID=UPI003F9C1EB7
MNIKQISVFLENKPGALYAMTGVLAQNQVDLRALSVAETKDFGIVRMIADDVYKATTVLKEAGYIHSITPVLGVAIADVPGGLNRVLQVLTDAKVNVEYMYAFLGGKKADHAYMVFRVENNEAATAALAARGIKTVEQEEMDTL